MDCGPLLDYVDLRRKHDEINQQRVKKDVTSPVCEADTDSNKLLDLRDGGVQDAKQTVDPKRHRDIENEKVKKQCRMQLIDLEQCHDSSLHDAESFWMPSAPLVPSAKHPETSVKTALIGMETSVKVNFDLSADMLSDLTNGSDSSTPVLEKGSVEAESSSKKSDDAAASDVEKADSLSFESDSDKLPMMDDSSSVMVDSCQVEPAVEKTSMVADNLPKKTNGDAVPDVVIEDRLPLESVSEKLAVGNKEVLVRKPPYPVTPYRCRSWIYILQELFQLKLRKISRLSLSKMFYGDYLRVKEFNFPVEHAKDVNEKWIPAWLLQSCYPQLKYPALRRGGFSYNISFSINVAYTSE